MPHAEDYGFDFEYNPSIYLRTKPGCMRNTLNRIGSSPKWYRLTWNRVLKYAERSVKRHDDMQVHIMPGIRGKPVDGNRVLSVLGWGFIWGYKLIPSPNGTAMNLATGDDGRPVPERKFGRVHIKYI